MKRNYLLFASVCLMAMMLMTSCTQRFPGYKKTDKGLYYKFYSKNASATQPKPTDILKVQMTCYLKDSLYYDFQQAGGEVIMQQMESSFSGDLFEAYAMMHVGDSASFYVKADSVAMKYYGLNPDSVGLQKDDYFRYEVRLVEVQTQEEFMAELERSKEALKAESEKAFAEYLEANGITEHTDSGLYYSKSKVTNGAMPQVGQIARITFVASYLDGFPLGDSDQLGGYYDLHFGKNWSLAGLEEGVGLMHVGEKGRFVLPYKLAYGDKAFQSIPAYSNLVYDVELLELVNETND